MLKIETKQIIYNRKERTSEIKYIVVHDTGNKSKGADADAHFKYFNGGNRNSSADFFVDDKKILQVNDYTRYYTWQVGDGKGKYGITNQNSIGIEICINADGDYDKACENAVQLVRYLMKELNIPIERVIRHYDASRKKCPETMSDDNWAKWEKFKEKIMKENNINNSNFTDIENSYAKNDIEELYAMGVVNGVTEDKYMPTEPITREAVAKIARNIIRYITGK